MIDFENIAACIMKRCLHICLSWAHTRCDMREDHSMQKSFLCLKLEVFIFDSLGQL